MNPVPKKVLLDANFLIDWKDASTDINVRARAQTLIARLIAAGSCVVIPTPALAEFLCRANCEGLASVLALTTDASTMIASFDFKAAFELHLLHRAGAYLGDKKDGVDEPWQKIKFDRQIVAIARANQCDLIVSADRSVKAAALRIGIAAASMEDLHTATFPRRRGVSVCEPGGAWRAA
ncbi:PIN domain-containing protein [Luteibacter yeojuensis]|uniref:PIN domain-containing protein n=1 Tax=Luteibacter yeojuensis TaxID=345309 RepID=A0A0F3KQQ4_9GAMM|nr:PIN domain-containing protein [Luteibacter yeojuensis]KJV33297.1 hypothetical protein VI08_10955 [Luteibacter yeojuensis]